MLSRPPTLTRGDWKEAHRLPGDQACQVRHFSHDTGVSGGVLNAKQDTLARACRLRLNTRPVCRASPVRRA